MYEVYTGVEDGDKFGMIASWNNSTDMPWYELFERRFGIKSRISNLYVIKIRF